MNITKPHRDRQLRTRRPGYRPPSPTQIAAAMTLFTPTETREVSFTEALELAAERNRDERPELAAQFRQQAETLRRRGGQS